MTEEDKILREYEDKINCSYQAGYNSIHIVVSRSFQNTLLLSFASILLAILVYIPINAFVSLEEQARIGEEILVYIPINAFVSLEEQARIGEEIVFPMVKVFA